VNANRLTPDTPKFVVDYIQQLSVDKTWQDWACRNYAAGLEHESLMSLIVMDHPINQFEAREIVTRLFQDLGIDPSDTDYWFREYVNQTGATIDYNSINEAIIALSPLKEIYISSNYEHTSLSVFHNLCFGLEDLVDTGVQWYHDDLTLENWPTVVKRAFEEYE